MNNTLFNKEKKKLNKEYYTVFNKIPCIQMFSCSREEYLNAMREAIKTKTPIEHYLQKVSSPIEKSSLP